MRRFGIWVAVAGLLGGLAAWAGGSCCPPEGSTKADKAKTDSCGSCDSCTGKGKESAECKAVCDKIKAKPGTVEPCCGKFCASWKDSDGKVQMACHIKDKCCAENFAKTGQKTCADCAKKAKGSVEGKGKDGCDSCK